MVVWFNWSVSLNGSELSFEMEWTYRWSENRLLETICQNWTLLKEMPKQGFKTSMVTPFHENNTSINAELHLKVPFLFHMFLSSGTKHKVTIWNSRSLKHIMVVQWAVLLPQSSWVQAWAQICAEVCVFTFHIMFWISSFLLPSKIMHEGRLVMLNCTWMCV